MCDCTDQDLEITHYLIWKLTWCFWWWPPYSHSGQKLRNLWTFKAKTVKIMDLYEQNNENWGPLVLVELRKQGLSDRTGTLTKYTREPPGLWSPISRVESPGHMYNICRYFSPSLESHILIRAWVQNISISFQWYKKLYRDWSCSLSDSKQFMQQFCMHHSQS